jgi:hypothetical protein
VLQLHRAELGPHSWRGSYSNGAVVIGSKREAGGIHFSDPAGPCFGLDGELFVANYGSKELVHLWVDEVTKDGESAGAGTNPLSVARERPQLRVDYMNVPGHIAAVCVSPDGARLVASIQEHHAERHPTLTGEHFLIITDAAGSGGGASLGSAPLCEEVDRAAGPGLEAGPAANAGAGSGVESHSDKEGTHLEGGALSKATPHEDSAGAGAGGDSAEERLRFPARGGRSRLRDLVACASRVGAAGEGQGEFLWPNGVCFVRPGEECGDGGGDDALLLAVTDFNNDRVQLLTPEGRSLPAPHRSLHHSPTLCVRMARQ